MLSLVLLAASAASPPAGPVAVTRPARAVAKIVSAKPLRFREIEKTEPALLRDRRIRSVDGSLQPARLVEFE